MPADYAEFAFISLAAGALATLLLWRSHRIDRSVIAMWVLVPLILVAGWFLVDAEGESERKRLSSRIQGMAPTYASELSLAGHAAISPATDPQDPSYLALIDKQVRWLALNPAVADIYTFRRHPDGNQLIVDSETDYDHNGAYEGERERRTGIGEIWAEWNDQLTAAYSGQPVFDDQPYSDRWGTWVSAFVPMFDDAGNVEAVLGVDYPAAEWIAAIGRARLGVIGHLAVLVTLVIAASSIIAVLRASIAERRRSEGALRQAKEDAERAARVKGDFLANMSHEVRTPLHGIIGITQLLLESDLNAQQRDYQKLVKQSADALLALLNDILDFSRLDAGSAAIVREAFCPREWLGGLLQAIGYRAAEKHLELAYRVRPDVPDSLIGDKGWFGQVIVNLVGNALKFTAAGEVVVEVGLDSSAGDELLLQVTVSDTGIGIPPGQESTIFTPFLQLDAASNRSFGGAGLGLAISAHLVRLMRGRIWVESRPGQGSRFHFTAAFRRDAAAPRGDRVPPPGLRDLRVLVVDDNATSRLMLQDMLSGWGVTPIAAQDGAEALEKLEGCAGGEGAIGLMLLDCMMPGMDGPAVAARVRDRFGAAAPRIVLLAYPGSPSAFDCTAMPGVERVLIKPVMAGALLDAITDACGAAPADAQPPAGGGERPPRTGRRLKLLVVEDAPVNRLVVTRMLEARGHAVVAAVDGHQALEALEREAFDVVLMDLQMPVMDGYQATASIRDRERGTGGHVPVVALTANALSGDRERCLAQGMDDYLAKPLRAEELWCVLERVVPADAPSRA